MKELTVELYILSDKLEVFDIKEKFEFHERYVLALYFPEKLCSHIVDEAFLLILFYSNDLCFICCSLIFISNDLLIIN